MLVHAVHSPLSEKRCHHTPCLLLRQESEQLLSLSASQKIPPPQGTSLSKLYTSSPVEAHMEMQATGLLLPVGLANNTPVGIASQLTL